jgi:hypothetical protein
MGQLRWQAERGGAPPEGVMEDVAEILDPGEARTP